MSTEVSEKCPTDTAVDVTIDIPTTECSSLSSSPSDASSSASAWTEVSSGDEDSIHKDTLDDPRQLTTIRNAWKNWSKNSKLIDAEGDGATETEGELEFGKLPRGTGVEALSKDCMEDLYFTWEFESEGRGDPGAVITDPSDPNSWRSKPPYNDPDWPDLDEVNESEYFNDFKEDRVSSSNSTISITSNILATDSESGEEKEGWVSWVTSSAISFRNFITRSVRNICPSRYFGNKDVRRVCPME